MPEPSTDPGRGRELPSRLRWAVVIAALAAVLAGCGSSEASDGGEPGDVAGQASSSVDPTPTSPDDSSAEQVNEDTQEETCDWDSARVSGQAKAPQGKTGKLPEVIVGAWQHTHTDDGSGFEEVDNDHRFVFPSPDRMLYCQHVPGATEHQDNAADITLNGTEIELPGGKYGYAVTAWDGDTMVWDNPVGNGYVYLLQRR